MGMTGTRTVHMEEGPRRVLPGAAARPARIVSLVTGLHGAETQRPPLDHCPRRQRPCRDTAPRHPHIPKPSVDVPPVPGSTYRATRGWVWGCQCPRSGTRLAAPAPRSAAPAPRRRWGQRQWRLR